LLLSANSGLAFLDSDGSCLTTTDAQCRDTALFVVMMHRVHERNDDARARGPNRVTLSAGAAVNIDFAVVKTVRFHR
jgi:hypothetical protein